MITETMQKVADMWKADYAEEWLAEIMSARGKEPMNKQKTIIEETPRILVVDDDEALLFAFKRIFRDMDIVIDSSDSIDETKILVARHQYSLVITDLRFNDVHPEGGLEIIRHVKTHCPTTRTVLWTAYGNPEMEERIDDVAPDFHLKKPVPSERIRDIMRDIGVLV